MITKDFTVIKEDPLIEFPPTTRQITYFINKSINPSDFEQADTVLIDKNIYTVTAATGFSILGVDSTNISMDGKTIMIMIVYLRFLVSLEKKLWMKFVLLWMLQARKIREKY